MGGRFVRAMAGASAFVLCTMLSPALAQSRDLGKVFLMRCISDWEIRAS